MFSSKGYHAATVDDITRAAGVAKGTYYLYFAEKRTAFYELIEGFFGMVTEAMSVAAQITSSEDYLARMARASRQLARVFRDNRDLVRLTFRESMGLDEQLESMVREFYREMARLEAENVELGVRLGLLRPDLDPTLTAYAHIGMVERVLMQWLFDRSFPEIHDLVDKLVSLAYQGMERRDAKDPGRRRSND